MKEVARMTRSQPMAFQLSVLCKARKKDSHLNKLIVIQVFREWQQVSLVICMTYKENGWVSVLWVVAVPWIWLWSCTRGRSMYINGRWW